MTKFATITETKYATKVAKSQLDNLSVRMTIALLRRAISDGSADALKLWRVADAVCRCLRQLPQTDAVSAALRWSNRAMQYDDDATLARWCLEHALEALIC